ncbi:MAG: YHYH protein [Ferruginibacter sp.]
MKKKIIIYSTIIIVAFSIIACKKSGTDTATVTTTTTVPAVYSKIYGASNIYIEGNFVVIKTTGLPDHKSPYYQGTAWASLYEAYNGTNPLFNLNPNRIAQANATFKIPLNPTVASTHAATPLGAIGVAVNGVSIFNQYAAGGSPLTGEINSFDQYDGHPQQQGVYHYHAEPYYITTTKGKDALIGFLLDGFPVYGPMENGVLITNANLDAYHGHTTVTADYPNGIYHYHTTAQDPYINGSGFYGTAGTVTQ